MLWQKPDCATVVTKPVKAGGANLEAQVYIRPQVLYILLDVAIASDSDVLDAGDAILKTKHPIELK